LCCGGSEGWSILPVHDGPERLAKEPGCCNRKEQTDNNPISDKISIKGHLSETKVNYSRNCRKGNKEYYDPEKKIFHGRNGALSFTFIAAPISFITCCCLADGGYDNEIQDTHIGANI
jgi:hypothetical protein